MYRHKNEDAGMCLVKIFLNVNDIFINLYKGNAEI